MSIRKIQCATKLIFYLALLLTFVVIPQIASTQDDEGVEEYKVRITALWFRSSPTITMEAAGHNGLVNFNRDFNFNDYSTFSGKIDWKFTHKNHLFFVVTPFNQSRGAVLTRTVTFRGQTFTTMAHPESGMRQMNDPLVMAGPLFQPLRGLVFATVFYPLRERLFCRRDGWLVMSWILIGVGILSTFSAATGSIEGMIYTLGKRRTCTALLAATRPLKVMLGGTSARHPALVVFGFFIGN
jgi:hypothetical protein